MKDDKLSLNLSKTEREALEVLHEITTAMLKCETCEYKRKHIRQLSKMGIDLNFISHKEVKKLVRGKEKPFFWHITEGEHWIRGQKSKRYLPFQIKELKE